MPNLDELDTHRGRLDRLKKFIIDEAEKGIWCIFWNLEPSSTGRMIQSTRKFKI
jgi:hypothetical protein